jgi:hypothetical protein
LRSRVWIEGEDKVYERQANTGFTPKFHFWPNCGSNLFWETRSPDTYGITAGSFADSNFPNPNLRVVGRDDVSGGSASPRDRPLPARTWAASMTRPFADIDLISIK